MSLRVAILCLLCLLVGGTVAVAQPAPAAPTKAGVAAQPVPAGAELQVDKAPPTPPKPVDRDLREGSGSGMAVLFWLFAAIVIGGSIFVITRRNLIAAVMGMVGTFFGVAALYMMLYAQFLAVVQMLVYAGAIMVLFVFVIMILNKPEDEPWGVVGLPGKALAGVAMLYLVFRLGSTLWGVKPPAEALAAPAPVAVQYGMKAKVVDGLPALDASGRPQVEPDIRAIPWGSTAAVGENLFDEYLFPFEAISILLLVAVVGAIAVARPLEAKPDAEDEALAADAEEAA